jgi:hypothetical protein
MEQLQPDLLVDITDEDLDYADRLGTLILLVTWSNAFEILYKLYELEEMVEVHDLLGQWFSAHARVDGAVVMVMTPDIRLVSP